MGEGRLGAVVARAERYEDNNPNWEICKLGALHEGGSVYCEGVLQSTHKLEKLLK